VRSSPTSPFSEVLSISLSLYLPVCSAGLPMGIPGGCDFSNLRSWSFLDWETALAVEIGICSRVHVYMSNEWWAMGGLGGESFQIT
jgi:hypothetical protein